MKKNYLFTIALAMTLSLFSCSSNQSTESTEEQTEQATEEQGTMETTTEVDSTATGN